MADQEEETQVTGQEARAGATPHMTRYILGFSLALIVVVFAVMYFYSAG